MQGITLTGVFPSFLLVENAPALMKLTGCRASDLAGMTAVCGLLLWCQLDVTGPQAHGRLRYRELSCDSPHRHPCNTEFPGPPALRSKSRFPGEHMFAMVTGISDGLLLGSHP